MNTIYISYKEIICNTDLCNSICLNLFNHSETAVSHLKGRSPDHRQVYTFYAWFVELQEHFDLDDFE
jgi:hypothetical protein